MSVVIFPFKHEELSVVAGNLEVAARHERVDEVWAVAAAENTAMADVALAAADIRRASGVPVVVFAQERLGEMRSGKGDGMNTAIAMAAERGVARAHFYDADITNFDRSWIDGAEHAADLGYRVVRHRFPRASTDAMITWMITRPALAMLFPRTALPRLGQPLGGEILLGADAMADLAANPHVVARSDWGIDTLLTHATALMEGGLYEHNAADGKRHALYGALTDIREMVLECLDAAASLRDRPGPPPDAVFEADPPAEAPDDLKRTVAYDTAGTRASLAAPPLPGVLDVYAAIGVAPDELESIDAVRWGEILGKLLASFRLDDESWREAAFRLWSQRVLSYTTSEVPKGYDSAMSYLEKTIRDYEDDALGGRGQSDTPAAP